MSSSLTSAYNQLGPLGIVGMLVIVAGIAILSYHRLIVGAGVSLVLAGVGIVTYAMVRSMMRAFGMMAP